MPGFDERVLWLVGVIANARERSEENASVLESQKVAAENSGDDSGKRAGASERGSGR